MHKKIIIHIEYQVKILNVHYKIHLYEINHVILLAELDKGDIDGLDFWDQTKDFLEPVLDKNNTYSAVYNKISINRYNNKI